jgi:GNAT superfamily N-acetyltransferase
MTEPELPSFESQRAPYSISTDRSRLDLDVIAGFLQRSYWAPGRSRERIALSIACSIPFGLYHHGDRDAQVGFARVVTDYVTIAFLADVFVLEPHRGQGLGVWLVESISGLPELARVRRWLLGTRDAHELYRKFGFEEPEPGMLMNRLNVRSDEAER